METNVISDDDSEERLKENIDSLRLKMYEIADEYGFGSRNLLRVSRILDQYILAYVHKKNKVCYGKKM